MTDTTPEPTTEPDTQHTPAQAPAEVCSTGFLTHTHDTGNDNHIFCLTSCECGKPSILPVLFQDGALVTLTLHAPDATDPRGANHEHPRIDVHVNPGEERGHNPCLTFDACGVCFTAAFQAVFGNGGGRIGIHTDAETVVVAPFRIANWRETRAALKTVQARHTGH